MLKIYALIITMYNIIKLAFNLSNTNLVAIHANLTVLAIEWPWVFWIFILLNFRDHDTYTQ